MSLKFNTCQMIVGGGGGGLGLGARAGPGPGRVQCTHKFFRNFFDHVEGVCEKKGYSFCII